MVKSFVIPFLAIILCLEVSHAKTRYVSFYCEIEAPFEAIETKGNIHAFTGCQVASGNALFSSRKATENAEENATDACRRWANFWRGGDEDKSLVKVHKFHADKKLPLIKNQCKGPESIAQKFKESHFDPIDKELAKRLLKLEGKEPLVNIDRELHEKADNPNAFKTFIFLNNEFVEEPLILANGAELDQSIVIKNEEDEREYFCGNFSHGIAYRFQSESKKNFLLMDLSNKKVNRYEYDRSSLGNNIYKRVKEEDKDDDKQTYLKAQYIVIDFGKDLDHEKFRLTNDIKKVQDNDFSYEVPDNVLKGFNFNCFGTSF